MGAYAEMADKLRERGYSAIPIQPGTKVPGDMRGGQYRPLSGWQQYGYVLPASFIHERWCAMPGAGVGIAHGRVVALDIDTDRADVRRACYAAITPSVARRRGRKGELGYYLGGDALAAHGARVRWYDGEAVAVELLLGGSQSVLPPSIHPDTNKPYIWIGEAGLSDLDMDDLPLMPGDAVALLDAALGVLGLTRQAPRRLSKSHRPSQALPSGADLDKPYFRSINDRALEPAALDGWWPALAMPKSRQRGPGLHEAVACWRPSSSGRPNSERNPNLKASPGGIVDFGEDRAYTAIDVVV
ncbi:MAG: bifunctional DNA primase/polymerase, partial [Pseudomonadota bacterium]